MSTVIRVPDHVHAEAKHLAGLRGEQAGDVIADAWREYVERNRESFAAELEQAAAVLRNGTLEDLARFASRNASARAAAAAKAAGIDPS